MWPASIWTACMAMRRVQLLQLSSAALYISHHRISIPLGYHQSLDPDTIVRSRLYYQGNRVMEVSNAAGDN